MTFNMDIDCNKLSTAVWVYDIDKYCIHWANEAALTLWEAESLTELCARDFRANSSQAVQNTLLSYRESFLEGKVHVMFWEFSPKNILKEAFCQMSGYTFADGRVGLKCEAIDSQLINQFITKHSSIMLSTFNSDGQFISGNPPFIEQMGETIKSLEQLFNTDKIQLIDLIKKNKSYSVDCLLDTKDGKLWFNLQASIASDKSHNSDIIVQQFNINERKLEQIHLTEQANTDALTTLYNRRGLHEKIGDIEKDAQLYIYFIDLDKFKVINDSMGHAVGDLVLKTLAKRLLSEFNQHTVICRFGGDEFILVIDKKKFLQPQSQITNKLLEITNIPYSDDHGNPILVSASVGSVQYPRDGKDLSNLLLRADAAMYKAKAQGRKRGITYTEGMEDDLQRSSLVARYLYLALQSNELELYYQPIMNTATGEIFAFEALLRWQNPILGLVQTPEVIAVAERIGIMSELDNWVINQAFEDLATLRLNSNPNAALTINISSLQFADTSLPELLLDTLKKHQLQAKDLIIDISEGTLIQGMDEKTNYIQQLTQCGMQLCIDDFGSGFSSLSYLDQIPNCMVKIDQCFTHKLTQGSSTVASLHHLFQSLHMTTVMEGVETAAQSALLDNIGINLQQGFFLERPQPLAYYLKRSTTVEPIKLVD